MVKYNIRNVNAIFAFIRLNVFNTLRLLFITKGDIKDEYRSNRMWICRFVQCDIIG